ncbi:hypothetical protein ACJ2A9_06080 [Anaerobacillus sp. MEB173]|uniref:hypothetical protein n=1 Tax=Anaerobacillus sp. MEB173 TaxID=3383345 RepID=UPI003F91F4F9
MIKRKHIFVLISCILLIGIGIAINQFKVNNEYREIENQLLPKVIKYNGAALYLDKQIGQELYLSITFESTGTEDLDVDYLLKLTALALETPAQEIFIWVYKNNTLTEAIFMERDHIEKWMNGLITKEQFVSGWDIEGVILE